MTNSPTLWIIAGPNGAGKTTSIPWLNENDRSFFVSPENGKIPYINPDIMAAKLDPQSHNNPDMQRQAAANAITLRNRLLEQRSSFAMETTLSGQGEIKLIDRAIQAGYDVKLYYVGLESAIDARSRVNGRVAEGGHEVPTEAIFRRYDRSLANLSENLNKFTDAYVFDNSSESKRPLLVIKDKSLINATSKPPEWFKDIHKATKLAHDKQLFISNDLAVFEVPYNERLDAYNAGLYFNSYIKKYTAPVEQLSDKIKPEWSLHHFADDRMFDEFIPRLSQQLTEMGYRTPESINLNTPSIRLHREETYQEIVSSSSFETISDNLSDRYDAVLKIVPQKNNLTAFVIDGDRDITRWDYRSQEKVDLNAKRASQQQDFREEQTELQNDTAERAQVIYEQLEPIKPYFGYLQKKQINAYKDIKYISFQDRERLSNNLGFKTGYNQMVVPIRNIDGDIRSLQIINKTGEFKGFLSDGEIKGNFATVGTNEPTKENRLIIAEGYATAASIFEATGIPVVVAFQANNLLAVAQNLRDKNPHQALYFGADNDVKSLNKENGKNIGIESALIAAEMVNGKVITPPIDNAQAKADAQNGWDWNDYSVSQGKHTLRETFLKQISGRAKSHGPQLLYQLEISKNGKSHYYNISKTKDQSIAKSMGTEIHVHASQNGKDFYNVPFAFKDETTLQSFISQRERYGHTVSKHAPQKQQEQAFDIERYSPKLQLLYRQVTEHASTHNLSISQKNKTFRLLEKKIQQIHNKQMSKPKEAGVEK